MEEARKSMRRAAVLLMATMTLGLLLAGGVAQAIINGEPDRGPNAHPYVGALVTVPLLGSSKGNASPSARVPSFLPGSSLPQGIAQTS
jgi:hypothetical protein